MFKETFKKVCIYFTVFGTFPVPYNLKRIDFFKLSFLNIPFLWNAFLFVFPYCLYSEYGLNGKFSSTAIQISFFISNFLRTNRLLNLIDSIEEYDVFFMKRLKETPTNRNIKSSIKNITFFSIYMLMLFICSLLERPANNKVYTITDFIKILPATSIFIMYNLFVSEIDERFKILNRSFYKIMSATKICSDSIDSVRVLFSRLTNVVSELGKSFELQLISIAMIVMWQIISTSLLAESDPLTIRFILSFTILFMFIIRQSDKMIMQVPFIFRLK